MIQDEIIEMARQAEFIPISALNHKKALEAFAKLVAAKEREACAKVTEDAWMAFSHASVSHDAINPFPELKFAANAIRARGKA